MLTVGALLWACATLVACDEHPRPSRPERPARPERPEEGEPHEAPLPGSAWPTETESLKDDVDREETDEECRTRIRNNLPSAVAESIADFGYDSFVDEVCTGLRALRDRSVETCDTLSVSTAKRGCRTRLALLAALPNVCPDDPVAPGRDPVCLAWAQRDRGACVAAEPRDIARCRAVIDNRAEECEEAPATERNRCRAEVARYGTAIPSTHHESGVDRVRTEFHVELDWLDSEVPSRTVDRNVLDRGIVLHVCGDGVRFTLHEPVRVDLSTASILATSPLLSLSLRVPELRAEATTIPIESNVAVFRFSIPREGDASSVVGGRGTVHLDPARRERYAPISGNFDVELTMSPSRVRAQGRFRTYVRDIITQDDEACVRPLEQVP